MSGKKKKLAQEVEQKIDQQDAGQERQASVEADAAAEPQLQKEGIAAEQSVPEQPAVERLEEDPYRRLEEQLALLQEESRKMQGELQKIRDRKGSWNRRFYRELLESEMLGAVASCYIENKGKKELYGAVRKYLDEHTESREAIRAELRAARERSKCGNVSSLACAVGILSVAGLIFAVSGMALGAVVLLFLVLIALSAYVWENAERSARVCCCTEYLLTVLEDSERSKKL